MLPAKMMVVHSSIWLFLSSLLVTTVLSLVLIVSSAQNWLITGSFYDTIVNNRASTQLIIQLISGILGLIHGSTICRLINQAARIRLLHRPLVRLQTLKTWTNLSIPRFELGIPFQWLLPVIVVTWASLISSALWTGSVTPVLGGKITDAVLQIPSYRNVSFIQEYGAEVDRTGPSRYTTQGLFTYSIGLLNIGNLLVSAASATTTDGSNRKHSKGDYTQFVYSGRSYGVGASVGLMDSDITSNSLTVGYSYQESGYLADVNCIYNSTSDFTIKSETLTNLYPVSGFLPDSSLSAEYSVYLGHDTKAIVAIGVAHSIPTAPRYLAFAAGESYAALDKVQCAVDFTPMAFQVIVDPSGRNITVTKQHSVPDFNPAHNLTYVLMRQYELIANDLTEYYRSTLGDAVMSSVTSWNLSHNADQTISESEATLRGVENAITAIADDLLVAYGSAQMMVGNFTDQTGVEVRISAFMVGQQRYIIAVAVVNFLIVLLVIEEAIRTKGWRDMPAFDFSDPLWFITSGYQSHESGHGHSTYDELQLPSNDSRRLIVLSPSEEKVIADADVLFDLREPREKLDNHGTTALLAEADWTR
ncbi:hypothetical protein F4677DRAFT_406865 [Hypoxylon crocopeplum]|nr:hypothetical protein F4677DRAFT_406865 [Hypoxylon crocopeplum]